MRAQSFPIYHFNKQDVSMFPKIYEAAQTRNDRELRNLLEDGVNVDAPDEHNRSAAEALAQEGDRESANFLIQHGANIKLVLRGAINGQHIEHANEIRSYQHELNLIQQHQAIGLKPIIVTSYFDTIYQLAKDNNRKVLEVLIAENIAVDEIRDYYTCAEKVAEEGDSLALELLLELGANVHKAIRGAAKGRQENLVVALQERGGSIHSAAEGYAIGHHTDRVQDLLKQNANPSNAAVGYCLSGHVEAFIDLYKNRGALYYMEALKGLATAGYIEKLDSIRDQLPTFHMSELVEALAKGGHEDAIKQIENNTGMDCSKEAAYGYALGGHIEKALAIMSYNKHAMALCPQKIALSGYLQVADALRLQGADPKLILQGAKAGGHSVYANKLEAIIEQERKQTQEALCEDLMDGKINDNLTLSLAMSQLGTFAISNSRDQAGSVSQIKTQLSELNIS